MSAIGYIWLEPLTSSLVGPDSEIPGLTTSDISWLMAFIEIGEVCATVPAGLLADKFGRKRVLLGTGPVCLLGWILILTTRNLPALYLARIIQGIVVATAYTVVPMYIAEISEPRIRGEITGQFVTFWYIGVTFNYIVGSQFEYQVYNCLCSIPPITFILVFAYMPESPYYLLMAGKPERAKKALQWFRNSNEVDGEFKSISTSVENDMKSKGSWRDLIATKKDRKAFYIVQLVCCIKYLNGIPAIISYATETFKNASPEYSHTMTVVFGFLLTMSSFGSALISDTVGRRPLLLWSTVGSVISNIIVAAYYFLAEKTSIDVSEYYWFMFVAIGGFCIFANLGLGPLMQTIQAEYFPSNTRGIGCGVTGMTASVTTFISLKSYQMLTDAFGLYSNYVTYVFFGTVGFIIMYFTIPETAGKSLGEIQNDLAEGKEERDSTNGVGTIKDTALERF